MGFFGALGKILAGKPVYGPENTTTTAPLPGQAVRQSTTPATPMQKVIPVVRVTRAESHINGNRLEVNLEIRNESPVTIWIDKVYLLGTMRDLNDDLSPGGSHEFQIYSGPVLQNDSQKQAEVQYYTDVTRAYFAARHEVLYRQQADGLHVDQLRLITPIRELR
jgi:hypothetical protein